MRATSALSVSVSTASAFHPVFCSAATSSRALASAASTAARSSLPSSARPSAWRSPGTVCSPPNNCRARRYGQHQIEFDTAHGLFTENVQAVADLDILDLAQPAVDVQQHVVERVLLWPFVKAEVVVHLRGAHQRPDLLTERGQLARVERGDVGVLVEQLLQSRDVAVGFGACHRRNEVVDQRGVRAALGLGALPRIVHQERVDQRQVAQCGVGAARRGHAKRLAGQPLQVAVLAEVHHGVRAENGVRSSGRRPDSGGWVAGRGRGRWRPGSRRIPRGGWTISTTLPA